MSKRSWLLGVGSLVLLGLLLACGSSFNSSSDGLLLVGSQGSGLIETFSFTLDSGHISAIANTPTDTSNQTCVLSGLPSSMVVDPAGTFAYTILNANPACSGSSTGLAAFQINSNGTIAQVGTLVVDPNPVALAMDPAGKFLFVAEGSSTTSIANSAALATSCLQTQTQNGVCVYAIGSGGSLTAVPATYTAQPTALVPNFVALAASPTVFPGIGINGVQNAVCSTPGNNPPTAEYLYLADSVNYTISEFSVDTTTGALGNPPGMTSVPVISTGAIPAGVAVDPCDRFAYVSNGQPTNKISAYKICSAVLSGVCSNADGSLLPVAGSPFSLSGSANGPGPLVVDPFGNNVYVVGTLSNTVSAFKISPISGSLAPLSVATVATGAGPVSIAIRKDDNWMFVANLGSTTQGGNTVSQYSITPATGALNVQAPITTDNYPFGVAVK